MERKRFDEIDVLRAFGIIGVIIVHILTYNLGNPLSKFLWNNFQFVVVSFVFCSGFVLSSIYRNGFTDPFKTISWYKKRFIRLIIPFWIYLIAHYLLWIIFPNYFQGLGLRMDLSYILKSAIFVGGTNYNWLPLLFLQLTFLFPFFKNWIHKKQILYVYLIGAGFITFLFTFLRFPYDHYRLVMWIPWSLVLLLAMYISHKANKDEKASDTNKRYFLIGLIFFVLFLGLYNNNLDLAKSLNFYDHKYPTDFYYLTFGIALTCFSLLIARFRFWQMQFLKNIYFFISNNSYQIFFIHYILLDLVLVLAKHNVFLKNPFIQFSIISSISIVMVIILNKIVTFLNFDKIKLWIQNK